MLSPAPSNPTAEAVMWSSHARARGSPTSATAAPSARVGSPPNGGASCRSPPQRFGVSHFEARRPHGDCAVADVDQLTVGEHLEVGGAVRAESRLHSRAYQLGNLARPRAALPAIHFCVWSGSRA